VTTRGRGGSDRHLGAAAVAELLRRPAANVGELAARLQEPPRAVAAALRGPSIAPLVERRRGELRAKAGATSATLPDRRRAALAGAPWSSTGAPRVAAGAVKKGGQKREVADRRERAPRAGL
jgi:hypothetical protein